MQVEQNSQHPSSHPYPILRSYSGTDHQAVPHLGQSSLPLPVIIQPDKLVPKKSIILPRYPQEVTCPSCQQLVITKIHYQINASTWFMCCVVFFVGGFLGCCFLPFFMKSCKEAAHRCPQCNFIIGRRPLK